MKSLHSVLFGENAWLIDEEIVMFNNHGTMNYSNTLVLESGCEGVE